MESIEGFSEPIYLTQPLLPDIEKLTEKIAQIWDSRQVTNNGCLVRTLEKSLSRYLNVDHLSLFSNGTVALQLACRVLDLKGEVITTPFTFAATPHSLVWNNLTPVFCDIEDISLNINPDCIEEHITPETSAIMPVHVYGNPCDADKIQQIADRHGLKVIYDAAHAFGVETDGRPVGTFGDISMFSFHATKVYHCIEGGALAYARPELKQRADMLRNFGIRDQESVAEPGTNGKLNELQAAVGLLMLELVNEEINNRKMVAGRYRNELKDIPGLTCFSDIPGVKHNYAYFPVRIDRAEFGCSRDEVYDELKKYNVFARKYFYPLCSQFDCYRDLPSAGRGRLPVAEKAADEILVLPMHGRLSKVAIEKICRIIKHCCR